MGGGTIGKAVAFDMRVLKLFSTGFKFKASKNLPNPTFASLKLTSIFGAKAGCDLGSPHLLVN